MKSKIRHLLKVVSGAVISAYMYLLYANPVFALAAKKGGADGAGVGDITSNFETLQDIVEALVSGVGAIVLLWGFFEWGIALQSQDGTMQANAFKRIGGGMVMLLAGTLLSAFTG
jgi:hypothetical protein